MSEWGRGGLGSHKHGISGDPGRSRRLKMAVARDVENQHERPRRRTEWMSIKDLFRRGGRT